MTRIFTSNDFTLMPWKNGGGVTEELLRIPDPQNPADFVLRFSVAKIESAGPFSLFPGVDRLLAILNGAGIKLDGRPFTPIDAPLAFAGETAHYCELIQGSVQDFNVMIKRSWGSVSATASDGDERFLYWKDLHELWWLESQEPWPQFETTKAIAVTIKRSLL